jgi:hypothetical protein
MMNLRPIIAITAVTASMWFSASVQAELIDNSWLPIDDVVPGNAECGDEGSLYRIEGMQHVKVSALRNGMLAINVNSMGTLTRFPPNGSEEEAIFRQNINNNYPMMAEYPGDHDVYSYIDTVRVITKGGAPNVIIKARYHHAIVDGEFKSYVNIYEVSCGE